MGGRLNFEKSKQRDRIRDHGSEDIEGGFPAALSPHIARPSKAAQRVANVAAVAAVTRTITCDCGHTASIALPPAKRSRRLRCSKCGRLTEAT